MNEALATLVPALGSALLHFLWQGLLVGVVAAAALAVLRDARPQARYAVACIALLACLVLPAWSLVQALLDTGAAGYPGAGVAPVEAGSAAAAGFVPRFAPAFDALPWVVALWAAGAGALSLRMGCGWWWAWRLCRDAQPETHGRWQACIDRLAPAMGIGRSVALRLVERDDGPMTAGWWRPVVLLPTAVALRMPADLVEALLAHELAHVRRHDYAVNLLQGAAEALLFYHPVTWWLSSRIRSERELVADDLAAAALGDRRRLALALSGLDRHLVAQPPAASIHYAPAAHGGQLMYRIQQLVRPRRRAPGAIAILPIMGLVLVGAAFYAQARMAPVPAAAPTPAPTAASMPAVAAVPLPSPAVRLGTPVLPVAGAAATSRRVVVAGTDNDAPYALVRRGEDGYTMSGDTDDAEDIEAARREIDGDFLWFRRDGKAWVVRDAGTVAEARAAWAATEALAGRMQGIEARMTPHAARLEALGARMEALAAPEAMETPEVRAAIERMEALGERMGPLAEQQVALSLRMHGASDPQRAALVQKHEALARQQEALAREMEAHAATMADASARLQLQHAPIEALAREMEAASAPMQAVGEEMEALGERIGESSRQADARVRSLIDQAWRSGRAQPAPGGR